MRREIFDYFEIAGKLTTKKDDRRAFLLGAVALRRDGTLVSAINSMSIEPEPSAHAEFRVAKKCDIGATVYVARVRLLNGEFAKSRPCKTCRAMLINRGIEKIYYTIDHHSYGVINFKKNTEYEFLRVK